MSELINVNIKDIYCDQENIQITGIIIKKSNLKCFESKRNHGETCGVITITIRDSKKDFINCVVWGSEYFVRCYDVQFKMGNIGWLFFFYISIINLFYL